MSARPQARRVRIDLAYDGTDFAGWQLQPGQRTVQGVIEETLRELQGGAGARLRSAGRTDAGVHARGQVCDTRLRTRASDEQLMYALCRMLPPDVRPVRLRTVPDAFHSQRDATGKIYRYHLDLDPRGDPLRARYALHHPAPLRLEPLAEALALLPGTRDWSGFTSTACHVRDRVRRLVTARFEQPAPERAFFTFVGEGFLRYMVRNLVGTLLLIARGRLAPGRIESILSTGERDRAGPTAPAHGLVLDRVLYAGEDMDPM